jgi:uncharacterized coiled-coil DUF342 family protein
MSKLEILNNQIRTLNEQIGQLEESMDKDMSRLETLRRERDEAISQIQPALIRQAITWPTFIAIDEEEYAPLS